MGEASIDPIEAAQEFSRVCQEFLDDLFYPEKYELMNEACEFCGELVHAEVMHGLMN